MDVPLTALGHRVVLRAAGEGAENLAAHLAGVWSSCLDLPLLPQVSDRAPSVIEVGLVEGMAGQVEATAGGRLVASSLEELVPRSTQRVTLAAIAANSGRLLMLHGGAMVSPARGIAVAYVAPGGTGKTTLCRTLGSGWGYVTDETVGVLADGRVVPYPKPLSTRVWGEVHKQELAPSSLGMTPVTEPVALEGTVFLGRSEVHVGPPELEPLDALVALVLFGGQSSALWALPGPLRRLRALVSGQRVAGRLRYREAAEVEELLAG